MNKKSNNRFAEMQTSRGIPLADISLIAVLDFYEADRIYIRVPYLESSHPAAEQNRCEITPPYWILGVNEVAASVLDSLHNYQAASRSRSAIEFGSAIEMLRLSRVAQFDPLKPHEARRGEMYGAAQVVGVRLRPTLVERLQHIVGIDRMEYRSLLPQKL